jgi:type III restriction enzyme
MKFSFDADLDYQRQAIDAVTGLFRGQEVLASQFTVYAHPSARAGLEGFTETGYGNMLRLDSEAILANLHEVQEQTGLAPESSLESMNFTIEMETGTGKTYVYLRTIYELNQLYGFTKFMVVVPSVAIKEGVETSIRMLREHFGTLYGNPPMSFFQYDGSNPSRVRAFAASPAIEIMIVTIASINKESNRIYQPTEDLDFEVPADLIRATNPIIIVDEPQSVYGDAGGTKRKGAGRSALEKFSALATLRYSATHHRNDRANLVYRLDAIAAYDEQLVKQIEVDSLVTTSSGTTPYVKLLEVRRGRGGALTARVEADTGLANDIKRKAVTVDTGTHSRLEEVTGRTLYKDLIVTGLSAIEGNKYITFDTVAEPLREGESIGNEVSVAERARQMIAQTIRQHLLKEQEFAFHGRDIKVLSLIFVDSVAKYRVYGPDGEARPGEYAEIFEQEYARIAAEPQFATLLTRPAEAVARESHQGYFSIDRRKAGGEILVDTSETTEKGRQQAGLAYEQIMRDKVGLTTPGTPIRFIFTHSALQEGWDNPNVFQICVLRNMGTERWRRQSIGRGLRLCVDGSGNRVHGFDVNRLTVIANESYEEFADRLQRELADDLDIRFGVITEEALAQLTYRAADGTVVPLGMAAARTLYQALIFQGYLDTKGKVQETLRRAIASGDAGLTGTIGTAIAAEADLVVAATLGFIKRVARPINIRKSSERITAPLSEERLASPEFQELWERIRHRTEYRVSIAESALRRALTEALSDMAEIPKRKGTWVSHLVKRIDTSGLNADTTRERRVDIRYADSEELPDILSVLADHTQLTRDTLAHVLTDSGTLDQFLGNPQAYIDQAARVLNTAKSRFMVGGLRYELVDPSRPEADRTYSLSLFREADISGYTGMGGNIITGDDGEPVPFDRNSVYRFLVIDSKTVEGPFALKLRNDDQVKVFVKLPRTFTIHTPLGTYNPDWALTYERPDGSRYFVFETKAESDAAFIRPQEQDKIKSATAHFEAIEHLLSIDDLTYKKVKDYDQAIGVIERSFAQETSG